MTHELKTWPEYFIQVGAGQKQFEVRKDDGRNFAIGDNLQLKEWDPKTEMYTGRLIRARVTYIYRGEMVAPGHCILSIKKLPNIGGK